MMSGEAWLYLLSVLINAVNLFLQVFFTIMYSDLEWLVLYPEILSMGERKSSSLVSLYRTKLIRVSPLPQ